jgi:glycosyltransferase involved in cell wall biosynthesis
MRIIGFMEGTNPSRGGLGLVGVATILGGVASRGHSVALIACGGCTPGQEKYVTASVDAALDRQQGTGSFGIVTFKAARLWAFSPVMLWRLSRHVRNADFISLHSLYSFPVLAGYLLARFHGVPYGLWPHGALAAVQRRISIRKKRIYEALVVKRILRHASVLFFSASGERAEGSDLAPETPSVIIPDGIDLAEFSNLPRRGLFRDRYLSGHEGPLVVCIGRLNAKKGLDLLIEAMSEVLKRRPDARLAIVGPADPPAFRDNVMSWIRERRLEPAIFLTGAVEPAEKLGALADADVFVSASEAENFGFAVFEAMASRLPVVVSDTLDYAEEINRYDAGFAVRREPKSFAEGIVRLLNDPDLRLEKGLNGLQLANAYSWERTGSKIERTIHSILDRRPLPMDLAQPGPAAGAAEQA